MEVLQRDFEEEKLLNHRKGLQELNNRTSDMYNDQIKIANNEYIDEVHMEYLNSVDINFEDSLIIKHFVDFMKGRH